MPAHAADIRLDNIVRMCAAGARMPRIEMHSDASCDAYRSAWAARLSLPGGTLVYVTGVTPPVSSTMAELLAALTPLTMLGAQCEVTLHSDAAYIAGALKSGRAAALIARESKRHGEAVAAHPWGALLGAVARHRVRVRHVRSHSGVPGNMSADWLAYRRRMDIPAHPVSWGDRRDEATYFGTALAFATQGDAVGSDAWRTFWAASATSRNGNGIGVCGWLSGADALPAKALALSALTVAIPQDAVLRIDTARDSEEARLLEIMPGWRPGACRLEAEHCWRHVVPRRECACFLDEATGVSWNEGERRRAYAVNMAAALPPSNDGTVAALEALPQVADWAMLCIRSPMRLADAARMVRETSEIDVQATLLPLAAAVIAAGCEAVEAGKARCSEYGAMCRDIAALCASAWCSPHAKRLVCWLAKETIARPGRREGGRPRTVSRWRRPSCAGRRCGASTSS